MAVVRDILRTLIALAGLGLAGWGLWEKDPSMAKVVVGTLLFVGMVAVAILSNRNTSTVRGKRHA